MAAATITAPRRWTSRDPSGERSGINLYDYVFNRPINSVDLNGLGAWNFGTTTDSSNGSIEPDVTYTMDSTEKQCCKKATIYRYIRDSNPSEINYGNPWQTDDDNEGGFTDVNGVAHSQGDAPEGPDFGIIYRVPWDHDFKFVARCTSSDGNCKGKALSTTYKTWHNNGNLLGSSTTSGYWK